MKIQYFPLLVLGLLLAACQSQVSQTQQNPTPAATQPVQIANPASQNCIDKGGTLAIEERGDGGQFGVCYFEDNLQCEEWALMRGDCPVGGVKVTGYVTPAARYCAISGGTYATTGNSNTDTEQGTCTFKNGSQCDAWDYYNGKCSPGAATIPADWQTYTDTQAGYSLQVPPSWSQQPLPDQNSGNMHGTSYTGPEGGVEVYWGVGFGGACPAGTEPLQLAQGEVQACHTTNSDGTQEWNQIDYVVNAGNTFSSRAYTSNAQQSSADLVLQVLSTLTFMPPATGGGSQQIVFDSNRGGSGYRDLYVMGSLGSDVRSLTTGDSNNFAGPWSPDGKRIVYTTFGLTNSQIAAINSDGSGQTILDAVEGSDEAFPDWSPDGSRIAFTSRRDGNNEIYIMNSDGSNPIRLTDHPGDDFAPSWSPDGARIVFVSDRDHAAGIYDLYIMNADGSGVTQLTNDAAIDYSPDWSPDGKKIVFRSHHGGPADIYLINVDGTDVTDLTNNPAEDWAPSWSADGSQIVFQTDRDGNWEIYRIAADGSDPVNLTSNPADDQLPYYAP